MATMDDVAARAGVSQATVSFVLGGRADRYKISRETRDRVLVAARELSYQRNQLARAMVTGKSRVIGVLTTPEASDNVVHILTGAMETAGENDYLLKMMHLSYTSIDDATIARCLEWRLAGAIIVGLNEDSHIRLQEAFQLKNIPIALIDNVPRLAWGVRVRSDDAQGIRLCVSHLTALGHRQIAFIGGAVSPVAQWREQSFREALAEAELPVPEHWIRTASWSDQVIIEESVRAFFQDSSDRLPTAVVCATDSVAMVVMRTARAKGLRLPDDLSVIGYSNKPLSAFADPPLTTVDQSFNAMGRAAASQVIDYAESGAQSGAASKEILLPTRFVQRGSTAPPRAL